MSACSDVITYNYMDMFFCCHVDNAKLCENMITNHTLVYICSGEMVLQTKDKQVVFKKEDYFEKQDSEYKNLIKWIIPNAQKNIMEPILLILDPGGSTYPDSPHEGEEFGFVLKGNITITLGNNSYKVKKGESFYYVHQKPIT